MVSKKELQAEVDKLRKEHERKRDEAWRLKIDNDVHRARERARMRRELAEQQRARQEAEREDRRKRRQELSDGMLRLADASEWAIVNDERGSVLELTVPLADDVEPIVHGVLTEKPKTGAAFRMEIDADAWQRHVQDSINRMTAAQQRIKHTYGF